MFEKVSGKLNYSHRLEQLNWSNLYNHNVSVVEALQVQCKRKDALPAAQVRDVIRGSLKYKGDIHTYIYTYDIYCHV